MLPKFNRPEMHASVIKAKLKKTRIVNCLVPRGVFSFNFMISECL